MKDRILGIENELAVIPAEGVHTESTDDAQFHSVLGRSSGKYGMTCGSQGRFWLPNGGCFYIDMQKLEWASPECKRVRDIVIFSKAAERTTNDIMRSLKGNRLLRFFKTNVAPGRRESTSYGGHVSFGCHENYMTAGLERAKHDPQLYMPLLPFLLTRQIYGGSGWWQNSRKFWRSQRANFMTHLFVDNTTTMKPLINQRDEPLTDIKFFGRFHLILGDANMLEHALFLKIGATNLMVSLLEEGLLPRFYIEPDQLNVPSGSDGSIASLQVFKDVAGVADLNSRILRIVNPSTSEIRKMTPIEVQQMYLAIVEKYVQHTTFPSEEAEWEAKHICSLWEKTLDALEGDDSSYLMGRVDWYTKKRMIELRLQKNERDGNVKSPDEISELIDVLYHETSSDSMYQHLVKSGRAVRIVTDREIERGMQQGPLPTAAHGTRATLRGQVVQAAIKSPEGSIKRQIELEWALARFRLQGTSSGRKIEFSLQNPLSYENLKLQAFLEAENPLDLVPDNEVNILKPDLGGYQ